MIEYLHPQQKHWKLLRQKVILRGKNAYALFMIPRCLRMLILLLLLLLLREHLISHVLVMVVFNIETFIIGKVCRDIWMTYLLGNLTSFFLHFYSNQTSTVHDYLPIWITLQRNSWSFVSGIICKERNMTCYKHVYGPTVTHRK